MGAQLARLTVLVLAVLAGVVAIASIWANDELLDTGSWVAVSGRLLESGQVRHRVAVFLGEEMVEETEGRLLAAGQDELAAQVMPRLRSQETELARRVMATPRFRAIWLRANRVGQRELLRVLDEEAPTAGGVVIDLTPALRRIADVLDESGPARELGAPNLAALVEPGAARIEVLEAAELNRARDVVRVVRRLTLPAVLATIALYLLALFLGRRRPRGAFLGVGLALAATGGLALLARALAGHAIVDQLLAAEADRTAAEAAWRIATSKVADLAGWAIGLGAVVVLLVAASAILRRGDFGEEAAA